MEDLEKLERVEGIEPSTKAWEAFVLPLNYTRITRCCSATGGSLRTLDCQLGGLSAMCLSTPASGG